jgi:DNA-binding IclR family transcriptional regulator
MLASTLSLRDTQPMMPGEVPVSQSVERSLEILDLLEAGPERLGPIAEALGVHKSTALRLLQVLERKGYVQRRGDSPRFMLGLRVLQLASRVLEDQDLRDVARPGLVRLAASTGETIHLATLVGGGVTYLDKAESRHAVRMYSRVGGHAPAYCTALGKVLLAYLPLDRWPEMDFERFTEHTITDLAVLQRETERIRARGWGTDEREHQDTIRCIAAPLFDHGGVAVAAISVSTPTSRCSAEELTRYVPELTGVAAEISRGLGRPLHDAAS